MNILEIGIVDARNIIKTIKEIYKYDFTDYALTSFKRRLEKIIETYNLKYADILIHRLKEDPDFFDKFLYGTSVETTEIFRDPSLWRLLRNEFFPRLLRNSNKFKIWIPASSSGEELYSMLILLKESNFLEKVQIIVSCFSNQNIEAIKSGLFNPKKIEVGIENYQRFNGKFELSDLYTIKNNIAYWDASLLNNVILEKQNIFFDNAPAKINLILFRNQIIYYNQTLQDKIVKVMHKSLVTGGYLIIGVKESLGNYIRDKYFVLENESENIYKKRSA